MAKPSGSVRGMLCTGNGAQLAFPIDWVADRSPKHSYENARWLNVQSGQGKHERALLRVIVTFEKNVAGSAEGFSPCRGNRYAVAFAN